MDRVKNLLAFVAMTSLLSCSEDVADINVDANPNGNSEFTIQLNGRSTNMDVSRAAIMDGSAGLNDISVWCVAKNQNDATAGSMTGINWFGDVADDPNRCLIKHRRANIQTDGKVVWAPETEPPSVYYYPITQRYKYEFYATWPHVTSTVQTASQHLTYSDDGTKVTGTYVIDGSQDLLWGRATSDEAYAWSARYFRTNGGVTDDNLPNLVMQHMLTRLVFFVQPGSDGTTDNGTGSSYQEACKMTVTAMRIRNVASKVEVVIADSNNPDMDTDARISAVDGATSDFKLKKEDGTEADPLAVSDCLQDGAPFRKQWGESVMLAPSNQYLVYLTMKMPVKVAGEDGTLVDSEKTFYTELPLTLEGGEGQFKRGTSYNVTITVYHPTEIAAKATIADWVEEEGPELEF